MNCICHDVVQQGHGRLIPFYHYSMLNNNLVNCYNKFYNNDSSDNDS